MGLGILVLTQQAVGRDRPAASDRAVAEVPSGCLADRGGIPTGVSFRRDVAPVLVASCSTRSCHGTGVHSPSIVPGGDPAKLRVALVGVASEERPSRRYVEPGDPGSSFLIDKIDGCLKDAECEGGDCGRRMPSRNAPLPDATRAILRAWITEGALDN